MMPEGARSRPTPWATASWPMRTVAETNTRDRHWAQRKKRRGEQKRVASWQLIAQLPNKRPPVPVTVVLVRVAPRRLDDDNNAGALKSVQDAVAEWLGIDDGDARVRWLHDQRRGAVREYAVEVEVYAPATVTDVRSRIQPVEALP